MDDIEKLIASLPYPAPTTDLDDRIAQVVNRRKMNPHAGSRRRSHGVLVASVACASLVAFAVGRWTAPPAIERPTITTATILSQPAVELTGERSKVVSVSLPAEQALTRFVMPPQRGESLFGGLPFQESLDSL